MLIDSGTGHWSPAMDSIASASDRAVHACGPTVAYRGVAIVDNKEVSGCGWMTWLRRLAETAGVMAAAWGVFLSVVGGPVSDAW